MMKIHRTSQNIFSEFFYVLYGSTELRFYGHCFTVLFGLLFQSSTVETKVDVEDLIG